MRCLYWFSWSCYWMKGNALVMLLNVPTGEKVTVWIAARRLYRPKRLVRITLANSDRSSVWASERWQAVPQDLTWTSQSNDKNQCTTAWNQPYQLSLPPYAALRREKLAERLLVSKSKLCTSHESKKPQQKMRREPVRIVAGVFARDRALNV